jgi:hypothetical protein
MESEKSLASKQKTSQKRITEGTLNKWKLRYTWLRSEYDKEAQLLKLYCIWCEKAQLINNMTSGCIDIQNSALEHHASRSEHDIARQAYHKEKSSTGTQKEKNLDHFFRSKKEELSFEVMLPTFKNVLWLAKECLPLFKAESLHQLSKHQGVDVSEHYRNHHAAREILDSINQVLVNLDSKIFSNCNFFGLAFDSSTDTSSNENLIITIKYLNATGRTEEKYLKLLELPSKKSNDIFDTIKPYLLRMNIFHKVGSIATDGEACMLSSVNGLAGKFRDELPHILSTHCIAHRLVLGCKPLCQDIIEFKALNNLIHTLCSFFHRSPKKMKILLKEEEEEMGEELKILMPNDERWLSHLPCLERIMELYVPIINSLTELSNEYPIALSLLTQLCRIKISALLHFCVDLIRPLYNASKIFQRKSLTLEEMQSALEAVRARMNAFVTGEIGTSAATFLSKVDQNTLTFDNKVLFDKTTSNYHQDISEVRKIIQNAAKVVLQHLDLRFPRDHKMYLLTFLSPSAIKQISPNQLEEYGNIELKNLIQEINEGQVNFFKRNSESLNTERRMESLEYYLLQNIPIIEEWKITKNLIHFEYRTLNDQEIYVRIHQNPLLSNIRKIYELLRSAPLTSVECERMFSRMNIIKTNLRNQLEEDSLDKLIRVSVSNVEMKSFNFHEAFIVWKEAKNRYFA